MANFGHFATFPIFSYQSGPKQLRMGNFGHFATFPYFPTEVIQIDLEWPILAVSNFSNIFLLKWSKLIENGQF